MGVETARKVAQTKAAGSAAQMPNAELGQQLEQQAREVDSVVERERERVQFIY